MLGPVSDTGRAMMASLQQAIQKGMPIDQAIAYVKGMATQGVAPMVDLYSMLNQFERLKQPPAQPPQGGTIRDQIAAAAAQRDHQEAMQRGLASMPVQRAPQEPMEQGLGSVPVPAMEGAQFAGGGIVAFDDGGFISRPKEQDPFRPDPEVQRRIREQAGIYDPNDMSEADKFTFYGAPPSDVSADDRALINDRLNRVMHDPAAIGAGIGAIVGGPIGIPVGGYLGRTVGNVVGKAAGGVIAFGDGGPTNKSIDYTDPRSVLNSLVGQYGGDPTDYLTREATAQEEAYKRMGLGAAAKAREEETARQQAEAEKYASTAGQGNLAQYFFELAANAAKPGAKFLTAAAAAAPGYGQRRTEIDERARALKNAAKESQLKLMEAEELRKAGYIKDAAERRKEGVKQMIDVGSEIYKAKTQKEVAGIYTAPRGAEVDIAKLKHIIATEKGDTPESQAKIADAQKRLNIIDKNLAAVQARLSAGAMKTVADMHKTKYKAAADRFNKNWMVMTDDQRRQAQEELDRIESEALNDGVQLDTNSIMNEVKAGPTAPTGAPVAPQSNPVGGTRLRYNPETGKIE